MLQSLVNMTNGMVTGILAARAVSEVSATTDDVGGSVGGGVGDSVSVGRSVVPANGGEALSWIRFIFYAKDNS